jgi:DNA-binding PucR family transcriptional regulator
MLQKLKAHYRDLLTTDLSRQKGYIWYITKEGAPFGLNQSEISHQEIQLLNTMFDEYKTEPLCYTPLQEKWKSLLTGDQPQSGQKFYRFIHFFSKQPIMEYTAFLEAVNGLFPLDAILLLNEDFKSGVIIETSKPDNSDTPYEALKDMISTDFYMDLSIYIGSFNNELDLAKTTYQLEKEQFLIVKNSLPPKAVYTAADVIPLLLIQSLGKEAKKTLTSLLADWPEEDKEILKSIKIFVECSMNISLAAKKLYIHRNSLQYRVDKFFDKTGIDVKQFKNALAVYMAILLDETDRECV